MGRRADWENAKEQYPSHKNGTEHWESFFDVRPDVMWSIFGDIAKVYVATDDISRRVGRRPGVHNMSLDDLELITSPRYSMDPISVSLPELIGNRSRRSFAARVPCHHSMLQRYIEGVREPDRQALEALARAGRVGPAYFREWRWLFILEAMSSTYDKHPNLSIAAYKLLTKESRAALPG